MKPDRTRRVEDVQMYIRAKVKSDIEEIVKPRSNVNGNVADATRLNYTGHKHYRGDPSLFV